MTPDLNFDATDDDFADEDDFFIQDGPGLFDEPLPSDRTDCDIAADEGILLDEPDVGDPEPALSEPAPPPAAVRDSVEPASDDTENLALYRRYRPDTFDDLIGQDHVTKPLMQAISNNRVNHAYLFSGPRGCGKTTSARILARALNCAEGPTAHPCGVCESCVALGTGGSGSIDVIEIDAASHGRVDDARDLRDGVYFAPVMSRYKVYIIDEAHMVTKEGFNALLKVVEEPPAHVKFIFATTEPEKVIGTIRSRTHHYPFRLVPPRELTDYLEKICELEQITTEQGVLLLVVRAGGGSVRDAMSVLDQLLGAADNGVVRYNDAVGLLGYTPESLLDEIVDAFAAGDGQAVFHTIDKVISSGQDPRRFAEDLLERLRDLMIVAHVPNAISSRLIDVPSDHGERLAQQAAAMGTGELTRAAEVIADGIVAMRGTTSPRLHLELLCSRVLLPQADRDGRGLHARLERIERRLDMPSLAEPETAAPSAPQERATNAPRGEGHTHSQPQAQQEPSERERERPATEPSQQRPSQQRPAQPAHQRPAPVPEQQRPAQPQQRQPEPTPEAVSVQPPPPIEVNTAAVTTEDVRRLWPQILDEVRSRKRFSHALISQEATVLAVDGRQLMLGFSTQGIADNFSRGGSSDVLRDSIVEVMGADLVIIPTVGGAPKQSPAAQAQAPASQHQPSGASTSQMHTPEPAQPEPASTPEPSIPVDSPADVEADEVSDDDTVLDESGEDVAEMLARELDAEIIDVEER